MVTALDRLYKRYAKGRRICLVGEPKMAVQFNPASLGPWPKGIGLTTLNLCYLAAEQFDLPPGELRATPQPAFQEIGRYFPAPDADDDVGVLRHNGAK
jgi:hypothetical protein